MSAAKIPRGYTHSGFAGGNRAECEGLCADDLLAIEEAVQQSVVVVSLVSAELISQCFKADPKVLHLTPDYQSEIESSIVRSNGHIERLIHRQPPALAGIGIVA